jgi:integrase
MPKVRLTKDVVENLKAPDPSGRQTLHWDEALSGFGVLVSGTTKVKTYVAQHRVNGLNRRVTIARADVIDLDAARERARRVIAGMYLGDDPKRQPKPVTGTLREAFEAYIKGRKNLRPSSVRKYRSHINKHLADWLDRPLRDVTRERVEERHELIKLRVESAKPSRLATGNATANDTMLVLSMVWKEAADRDDTMGRNPVSLRNQQYPVAVRTGVVPPDRLGEWCRAVSTLEARWRDYLMLLLYTGMRRSEAAALRWDEVDMALRAIRLPAGRTKIGRRLDLPMSNQVHEMLQARAAGGRDSSGYVFPGRTRSGHVKKTEPVMAKLAAATGIKVGAHDMRRTFITVAESTDSISGMALKALMNHTAGGDVTANYVQMTVERLRGPAQRVADRIDELRAKNVVDTTVKRD